MAKTEEQAINVRVPRDLWRDFKVLCVKSGQNIPVTLATAIREYLAKRKAA